MKTYQVLDLESLPVAWQTVEAEHAVAAGRQVLQGILEELDQPKDGQELEVFVRAAPGAEIVAVAATVKVPRPSLVVTGIVDPPPRLPDVEVLL